MNYFELLYLARKLQTSEYTVLMALLAHSRRGVTRLSQEKLAQITGVHRTSVARAERVLEDANLIAIRRKQGRRTSILVAPTLQKLEGKDDSTDLA